MIELTASKLARLKANYKAGRTSFYLIKMQLSGTWYYITDSDMAIEYNGDTYYPGYLADDDIDEVETTSEPTTNDINIKLNTEENSFLATFLSPGWMNGTVIIYEHHRDDEGEILTKNIYQGLIDSFSADEDDEVITVSVASVWADFEKTAGIKTNTQSQQRFYPDDTAFDHAAQASKTIYWGKKAPDATTTTTTSGGYSAPENFANH